MSTTYMQRVYVWQWPVRLYHWVNFLCICVLVATGFIIGRPVSFAMADEAYYSYWFGTARFVHFASAYESALIGTPIANPDQPVEVLRTIHSFDPCIACAVHLHDEHGRYVHQVRVF